MFLGFFILCIIYLTLKLCLGYGKKKKPLGYAHVEFETEEEAKLVSSRHLLNFVDLMKTLIDCFHGTCFWIHQFHMII